VVRHGKVQNYVLERQNQIFASGEWNLRRPSLTHSYAPYRIILENAPKSSDDTHQRKRRRLTRGVLGRHAQDMSLITSDNVHQRPQWRVTPLGRLIRPMRMRPARPLDPPIDPLRTKNVEKGSRKKKKRPRPPPTRARRQTIDPLRWGSTHLSGIFLDGNGNGNAPLTRRSGPDGDGSAKGESTEVDEVENILEVSDQTPTGDDSDDKMPLRASDAELDLAAERASALGLLNAMFGEANTDWGGAESIDSDIEMADVPRTPFGPLEPTDFEVVPAAHGPRASPREEKNSAVDRQTQARPMPTTAGPTQSSTQNKLKDLFAPREEEGESLAVPGPASLLTSPAPCYHRFLPHRPPRSRLRARSRNGHAPGQARLPKLHGACSCGLVQSQHSISRRAYNATQDPRPFAPVFLPAEGPRSDGQVHADGRRGGDSCSLGGGAW
jgi:hypothetical protein